MTGPGVCSRRERRLRAGAPAAAAEGRHRVRLREPAAHRALPARIQAGRQARLDLRNNMFISIDDTYFESSCLSRFSKRVDSSALSS